MILKVNYVQGHTSTLDVNWVTVRTVTAFTPEWPFLSYEDKRGTRNWVDYDLVESYETLTDTSKHDRLSPRSNEREDMKDIQGFVVGDVVWIDDPVCGRSTSTVTILMNGDTGEFMYKNNSLGSENLVWTFMPNDVLVRA